MNQKLSVFVKYIISEFCLDLNEKQDPEFYLFLYSLFRTFISKEDPDKLLDSFIPDLIEHLLPISYKPKEDYFIRLDDKIREFINTY